MLDICANRDLARAYLAGVIHGDGWLTTRSLGMKVKDRDFAQAFADALQPAFGLVRQPMATGPYWRLFLSNVSGRFNDLLSVSPQRNDCCAAWVRSDRDHRVRARLREGGVNGLRPFWRYYGGKWRASQADAYPQPLHSTIVEPFAGAAGYALRWGVDRDVVLVEKYPTIAAIWRWLITVDPAEVRAIPECDDVDTLPDWVPQAARWLVGFTMNSACSTPRKTLSSGRRMLRAKQRQFEGWTPAMRDRVAEQVVLIRHWKVIEDDYTAAPQIKATWFIDPPYQHAGRHYVHGSKGLDYADLAKWCRSRRGQPIVCEQPDATWLPFRTLGTFKAGPTSRRCAEAVWP